MKFVLVGRCCKDLRLVHGIHNQNSLLSYDHGWCSVIVFRYFSGYSVTKKVWYFGLVIGNVAIQQSATTYIVCSINQSIKPQARRHANGN
jgi:hypothetical protein